MTNQHGDAAVVRLHCQWLAVRGLRSETITGRRRVLTRVSTGIGGLLYLTGRDLEAWQSARTGAVAPSTIRSEVSHLRGFYAWAVRTGLLDSDPGSALILPRVPTGLPRPAADADIAAAMAAADPVMAAVLGLAAFAGLRACEIAWADWSHIGDVLAIPEGKGGRAGIVPLAPALRALLLVLPHRRGPLIRRQDGGSGRNQPHRISQRANQHLHGLGLDITLHQLRHRFATRTYAECLDIRAVQELCRHASVSTTCVYVQASSAVGTAAVLAASTLLPAA
jgi:integrase